MTLRLRIQLSIQNSIRRRNVIFILILRVMDVFQYGEGNHLSNMIHMDETPLDILIL